MTNRFDIGDLVSYRVTRKIPQSLGVITEVKDGRRQREWIPAAVLESAGSFRVLSKVTLTK